MSTATQGATIFYTVKEGSAPASPTHNGATPTGFTQVYSGPVSINTCVNTYIQAVAYKAGNADSAVTSYTAFHANDSGCAPMGPMSAQSSSVTIFSVWDGDWAILEEYTTGNALVEKYLQGYHGLVKTFVANVYYYQDELGSTSHIANATGQLVEYYKYDVYGKPKFFNSTSQQLNASAYGVNDLFTGQRWISQLGLYDDRNRFMSPDLGRFLQPDPIGFKGDASNLYRYCGNDWANRTDPTGLEQNPQQHPDELPSKEISSAMRDWTMMNSLFAFEKRMDTSGGNGNPQAKQVEAKKANDRELPLLTQDKDLQSRTPRQLGVEAAKQAQEDARHNDIYSYNVYRDAKGRIFYQKSDPAAKGSSQDTETMARPPRGSTFVANGHAHREYPGQFYKSSSHSPQDKNLSNGLVQGINGKGPVTFIKENGTRFSEWNNGHLTILNGAGEEWSK